MKLANAARMAEVVANLGVIITLIVLVVEVRENTRAQQRATLMDRSVAMNQVFFETPRMAEILSSIKAVDGWDSPAYEEAFADRYGTPIEDAILWARYMASLWAGLEADFVLDGPSPDLEARIRLLLPFADQVLFWETGAAQISNTDFVTYVQGMRTGAGPD